MLRLVLFSCCVVLCVGHKDCGQNEERKCVQSCPPQKSCSNRDIQFSCLQVVEPCQDMCACKSGFVRNDLGQCVTIVECGTFNRCSGQFEKNSDTCQGENEFFDCGSACDNECDQLDTQNRTNCPIASFVCNRKCYCQDGFARDKENKCVPIEQCDSQNAEDGSRVRRNSDIAETICTGENEVHTDCKKSCPPDTCLSIVARFKCDSTEPCKKGCVCKPGYLRQQSDSPCVPICLCSEMKNAPECELLDVVKR